MITDHGTSSYARRKQNDSANEDEANDDQCAPNALNEDKYHSNITNIQMQLDNIKVEFGLTFFSFVEKNSFCLWIFYFLFNLIQQQQVNAIQKDDEQTTSLKVPKLKLSLKLTKPFQAVESEQSSTESDSGSDDEDNDTTMQSGMLHQMDSNQQENEQQQQQQHQDQYAYDANNSLLADANESGSTAQTNTSIEEPTQNDYDNAFSAHVEALQAPSDATVTTQLPQHELHHANDVSISGEERTIDEQTNDVAHVNVSIIDRFIASKSKY